MHFSYSATVSNFNQPNPQTCYIAGNEAIIDTQGNGGPGYNFGVRWGTVSPVDVRLGKPGVNGSGTANWRSPVPLACANGTTASGCSNYPFEDTFRDPHDLATANMAALVDDAGYGTVNGIPFFCINMPNCSIAPAPGSSDIFALGNVHGVGALLTADNNFPEGKSTSWYSPGADNGIPNLNKSGPNGTVMPFNLGLGAESTWDPAISAEVVLTFKYPHQSINLRCGAGQVDGSITPAPGVGSQVTYNIDGTPSGPATVNADGSTFNILYPNASSHVYTVSFASVPPVSITCGSNGGATLYVYVAGTNSTAHMDITVHDAGNCLRATGIDVSTAAPVTCQSSSGNGIGRTLFDPSTLTAPASLPDGSTFVNWTGGGCAYTSGNSCSVYLPVGSIGTIIANYTQPPANSGCTTLPNFPSPLVDVALPDQTPPPPNGPPAYGFGSYTQNVPQGKTQVTAVNDISIGGSRIPPTLVRESYQSVTLDYTPYVQNYPYDNNQPSVSYNSYYDQYYYYANGPAVYNDYYTCDYYVYNARTGYTYQYDPATGTYILVPYTYYTYDCASYTFHHDFLGYQYNYTGQSNNLIASNTVNGPLMQYCYSRNFNLSGTNATNTYWSPSTENPTSVKFGSNVRADFSTSHGGIGVRIALQVNTTVTANYYVRRASGQVIPYPVPGRCGGLYSASATAIKVSDGYGTSGSADYPNVDCLNASIPPLQLGDVACFTITTNPTIGEVDPNGNTSGPRIGPVALYARSTTPDQPGISCTAPIINLPYARMYGNDVFAGGGFKGNGNTCTYPGSLLGNLAGNASGTTNQLATFAIGDINGFGSSQMVAPPFGLQFENVGGPPGHFTGSQCASDFKSQKPATTSSIPQVGNTMAWPLLSNGASSTDVSGTVMDIPGYVIPPTDVSGKANKIALFIKGDAHITGNITMGGAWTADKAPTFYLIATGNIYIDPSVTQLDGVYIAQPLNSASPLSSEGRIYTCSANAGFSAAVIFQTCANQLTVNGAFVAQQIKLQRTFGSMRDATDTENPAGSPHNCSISSIFGSITQQPICAAEVFNFSPEIYMAQPPFIVTGSQQFDAITSLPPVL
ncbi:MAG: hypothetical protein NVS1B7_2590 [Candidatus Saccharimonadales bacterium]